MRTKLIAPLGALVILLAGCSGETRNSGSQPHPENTAESSGDAASAPGKAQSVEPCFTVAEVGSGLSLRWDLVVASRGSSDQSDYIDSLMDEGEDLFEDIEDDPTCGGGTELADFNYEVAILNVDAALGDDTDSQYEKIADLGNSLLDLSDDQGYESSYEFVKDVSEIRP